MQKLNGYKMKELGIIAVYLFGSESEGATTIRSDIDIGIVLKDPKKLEDTLPLYNAIYSELSKVFKPTFSERLTLFFFRTLL